MRSPKKTEKTLTEELQALRSRMAKLKQIEAERRKAEEALSNKTKALDVIITNLKQGIAYLDENDTIIYLNQQCADLFGLKYEDVFRKNVYDFHPPGKSGAVEALINEFKQGKQYLNMVETVGNKVLDNTFHRIQDDDGNYRGILMSAVDITERKQAEEQLIEAKEYTDRMIEGMLEAITIFDLNGNIRQVNSEFENGSGWKREEAVGRTAFELGIMSKDEGQRIEKEIIPKLMNEGFVRNIETVVIRRDGTKFYALMNWTLMKDVKGNPTGIINVATDITERKQAEEQLLLKTTLLKAQSETSIDGILVVDSEGKSILSNERFQKMWSMPQDILDTKDDGMMLQYAVTQLKDPDGFLEKVKYLYAHREEKGRDEIEFKDGRVFDRYSSPVVDANGRCHGRIWYFRDITDRRKAEESLKKARNELEIRVERRTADLARAVKKLRNEIAERKKAEEKLLIYQKQLRSLASVLSLAEEQLRRRVATDVHDRISQNLAISKIKLESLRESAASPEFAESLDEIRDLIAQTIESTRSLTFELSPPVLYELGFEAAVEWLVRQTRQQHGLSTEFKDDRQPKPLDNNIRILLFQAVRELLINVVKHAQARKVKVAARRVNDKIQVSVKDDGVGFDISKASRHDYKAGGFGLFSIRERLNLIGGRLTIKSRPGSGTRITLVAPIGHQNENNRSKHK